MPQLFDRGTLLRRLRSEADYDDAVPNLADRLPTAVRAAATVVETLLPALRTR